MPSFLTHLLEALHLKRREPVMSPWVLYVLISLILLCETAALSFLKEFSLSHDPYALFAGMLGYLMVSFFLVRSYHYEGMGIVNVLWSAFSVVFVVLTGVVLFGERMTMPEIIGTAFVIAGVVIVRLPVKKKQKGGQCLHVATEDLPAFS